MPTSGACQLFSVRSRIQRCKSRLPAEKGDGMPLRTKPKLQSLWNVARETLTQESPTQLQIAALQRALSLVPLHELGLGGSLPQLAKGGSQTSSLDGSYRSSSSSSSSSSSTTTTTTDARRRITYLHIHEDAAMSFGIFCLPAGSQIPLHNHPGMTVLSRMLYGRLHVTSYDWESPADGGLPGPRAALPVADRVFTPADAPIALFPNSGGNLHRFTAETDCAVLDLLAPPYSPGEGRDCTYYREVGAVAHGRPVLLEEFEPPADFVIESGEYRGELVDTSEAAAMNPRARARKAASPGGGGGGGVGLHASSAPAESEGQEEDSVQLAKRLRAALLGEDVEVDQ